MSYLDTIPFLYGIDHADDLRGGLVLSDFDTSLDLFRNRRADIALLPVHVVPSLEGARIVSEYCLCASAVHLTALLAAEPEADVCRFFAGADAPLAALLTAAAPCPYAVWVAREEVDPEATEALEHALTLGMERLYEAVVDAGYDRKPYDAYAYLTHLDCVFDHQKHQALEKFWNSGMKVAPRANPG